MGILDRINIFKRRQKKYSDLESDPESSLSAPMVSDATTSSSTMAASVAMSSAAHAQRAQMDLLISQIESIRIQYDAINSRLSNIERVLTEIRSFCR